MGEQVAEEMGQQAQALKYAHNYFSLIKDKLFFGEISEYKKEKFIKKESKTRFFC